MYSEEDSVLTDLEKCKKCVNKKVLWKIQKV